MALFVLPVDGILMSRIVVKESKFPECRVPSFSVPPCGEGECARQTVHSCQRRALLSFLFDAGLCLYVW